MYISWDNKKSVLFCVLFLCKCVLYYYHRVSTQLQLTNISVNIISLQYTKLYRDPKKNIIWDLQFIFYAYSRDPSFPPKVWILLIVSSWTRYDGIVRMLKVRVKVASWGFSTLRPFGLLYSYRPTSSRIHLQRRHASYRCARTLPAKAGTITNEFC